MEHSKKRKDLIEVAKLYYYGNLSQDQIAKLMGLSRPKVSRLLAEARQKSGAQKLAGHDIMALERFDPDTRHMIVFDVLSHESPMGWKGEKMRLFLTEAGYGKALENQEKGFIKIRNHAKVRGGDLLYDRRDREL